MASTAWSAAEAAGTRGLRAQLFALAGAALVACIFAERSEGESIDFYFEEGTWMSVDPSPNGTHLVFDLLGQVYRVPLEGGNAQLLSGIHLPSRAMSHTPSYSPDGKRIVFVSDANGAENIWLMDPSGQHVRQLTSENGVSFGSPVFSQDGQFIIARRSINRRDGKLWLYEVESGQGTPLSIDSSLVDIQGPAVGNGRIWFSAPESLGESRALRRETWQIFATDIFGGAAERITNEPGGAVRPRVSSDGRWLTYATWANGRSSLIVRDLGTGRRSLLLRGIERNLQDMFISQMDLLPGYGFAPDSSAVYIGFAGKLFRVLVPSGEVQSVPFRARKVFDARMQPRKQVAVPESGVAPKVLRWPAMSKDRNIVVFEALQRLWIAEVSSGGNWRPVTPSEIFALQPSMAADGRIAFLSSGSDGSRHVMLRQTGGGLEQITKGPYAYAAPRFTSAGNHIVAVKGAPESGIAPVSPEPTQPELVLIDIAESSETSLFPGPFSDAGGWLSHDQRTVFAMTTIGLERFDRQTGMRELLVPRGRADLIVPSPDASKVAIAISNHLMVIPIGQAEAFIQQVSTRPPPYAEHPGVPGYFPAWMDEQTLLWSVPGGLALAPIDALDDARHFPADLRADPAETGNPLLLRGARVITMAEPGIIEHAELLIGDGRFICIGAQGECAAPPDATTVDLAGKTILPGLIDVHQHALALRGGGAVRNLPRSFPPASALLAYGVTSTRDPALLSNIRDFGLIEAINSGRVPGPRYFATGERVMPEEIGIASAADADSIVADLVAIGATSIKEYLLRDRRQRQWLRQAAAKYGIAITTEGGFDYKTSLTAVLDGFDGVEHSAGNHRLYTDALQLMMAADVDYTPTILTQIGAQRFFSSYDILAEPRLLGFLGSEPLKALIRRPRRGQGVAPVETAYQTLVKNAAEARAAGISVAVGAHDSPAPTGLGTHWEIWSLVEGGMSPAEALRAATLGGAEVIGIALHTGSIAEGKLADILILDKDPLMNIKNTLAIDSVMINGRLYDSQTLERIH